MPFMCCATVAKPWSAALRLVLALLVADGDRVERGQRLAIIEAMKMEHALTAPRTGRVTEIAVSAGSQVAEGARVMTIESIDE